MEQIMIMQLKFYNCIFILAQTFSNIIIHRKVKLEWRNQKNIYSI